MKLKYSDSYDPENARQFGAILRWFGKLIAIIILVLLIEHWLTGDAGFGTLIKLAAIVLFMKFVAPWGKTPAAYSLDDVIEMLQAQITGTMKAETWRTYKAKGKSGDPFLHETWETCRKYDLLLTDGDTAKMQLELANLKAERERRAKY